MQFAKIKRIRQNKKISRKKLCFDLGIELDVLKRLETSDINDIDDNLVMLLVNIANYLNISIDDIFPDNSKILNTVSVPKGITQKQVNDLYTYMLKHNTPILNKSDADKFFKLFKYFIGELKVGDTQIPDSVKKYYKDTKLKELYKTLEFDVSNSDNNNETSYSTDLDSEAYNKLCTDVRLACTIYKEVRNNGLDMIEGINILKVMLEILWQN